MRLKEKLVKTHRWLLAWRPNRNNPWVRGLRQSRLSGFKEALKDDDTHYGWRNFGFEIMWITDTSPQLISEGHKITCSFDQNGWYTYTAIWQDHGRDTTDVDNHFMKSKGTGKAYWKIKFEHEISVGGILVGVTDLKKFKDKKDRSGRFRGLLYGDTGYLSEGSGKVLVGEFGPWPKKYDTIGIYVNLEEDQEKLKVYIDVNGKSLGCAFDVPRDTLSEIIPVVHFSGPGTVTIVKQNEFPSIMQVPERFEDLQGKWSYMTGPIEALQSRCFLEIKKLNDNLYEAGLVVMNYTTFLINREGSEDQWQLEFKSTTKRIGSPTLMNFEKEMSSLFHKGVLKIDKTDGDMAIQISIMNKILQMVSIWQRFNPFKKPYALNPFNDSD